jgi:hypothetical protein
VFGQMPLPRKHRGRRTLPRLPARRRTLCARKLLADPCNAVSRNQIATQRDKQRSPTGAHLPSCSRHLRGDLGDAEKLAHRNRAGRGGGHLREITGQGATSCFDATAMTGATGSSRARNGAGEVLAGIPVAAESLTRRLDQDSRPGRLRRDGDPAAECFCRSLRRPGSWLIAS